MGVKNTLHMKAYLGKGAKKGGELWLLFPKEKPPTFFIPSSFDQPRSAKNDS